MANQVAFGAQLTESWKQIRRNRKLPNFMVILILIGLVFMVPCLVWGLVEARAHSGGGAPPRPPAVFMLYNGLLGLLYQPLIIGYFREFFCPSPASYSRPFRTGFARWRQVLCLLPLYVLYSIIWVVYSLLPPLLQLLFWLPFMVLMLAFGIYWQFLLTAAAAGEPDQPFSELYSRGGRAFCYGWWRMLVVFLILIGVSLVFGIPLILLTLMFAFGVPPIVPLILIIIWICVSIVVSVYIYTYMMACSARFFRDALGMPSDPDEQPGTEPEITQ